MSGVSDSYVAKPTIYNGVSAEDVAIYRMVGYFEGSIQIWSFGKLRQFCGFIFSWHTYSNHLVIKLKFIDFMWIRRPTKSTKI